MSPIRPCILLALLAGLSSGCQQNARVVTDDRDMIVSVDQLDVQDWTNAADQCLEPVSYTHLTLPTKA